MHSGLFDADGRQAFTASFVFVVGWCCAISVNISTNRKTCKKSMLLYGVRVSRLRASTVKDIDLSAAHHHGSLPR